MVSCILVATVYYRIWESEKFSLSTRSLLSKVSICEISFCYGRTFFGRTYAVVLLSMGLTYIFVQNPYPPKIFLYTFLYTIYKIKLYGTMANGTDTVLHNTYHLPQKLFTKFVKYNGSHTMAYETFVDRE